ncbi:MAG: VCBS repeat-containing protein [Planctomycetaceae bacterium]|nr:VCBS repeat-containing protein [Planctomycetaceae bacterium]
MQSDLMSDRRRENCFGWPALVLLVSLLSTGCGNQNPKPGVAWTDLHPSTGTVATAEQVRTFCGACHAVPRPESFPREAWYDEVKRGFNFYYDSGRTDLEVPSQASVTAYFQQNATEQLAAPEMPESSVQPLKFRTIDVELETNFERKPLPAFSFIDLVSASDENVVVRFSDMRSGYFGAATLPLAIPSSGTPPVVTANASDRMRVKPDWAIPDRVISPASIRECDLNGNGISDLIVADLGSFLPEDHDRGKVLLIPDGRADNSVVLIDRIGRVADVQVADLNDDELPDIVVGEFGWHSTGGIHVLLATRAFDGADAFEQIQLDQRPGAIHVLPQDMNGDGRLDIVALMSQEFEQVVAYLNQPDGTFSQPEILYAAPDPTWGSSGLLLHDMDNDGDQDILYTNGDTFDSYIVKPYHGIHWLENEGELRFKLHEIAVQPGVHRALPADLDGDGDTDVVSVALLPEKSLAGLEPELRHAIVWFENMNDGQYQRHVLERGEPNYAALVLRDLNGDGRPDILVGNFAGVARDHRVDFRILLNEG